MRRTHPIHLGSQSNEGVIFSVALTGAIVVIVSALFAIDMAAVRALFSLP